MSSVQIFLLMPISKAQDIKFLLFASPMTLSIHSISQSETTLLWGDVTYHVWLIPPTPTNHIEHSRPWNVLQDGLKHAPCNVCIVELVDTDWDKLYWNYPSLD